jgi:hypothetical protein
LTATERRDFAGAAVETTIVSNITAASTAITLLDATGWPVGANGPFAVVIDEGQSSEEKVKVLSRSGTSLTVVTSPTTGRGYDGTTASSHPAASTIRLCVTAIDLADANEHIYLTSRDDHTQYLNTTRHAAVSHTAAMIGTDAVTTAKIQDGAVTTNKLAADAVTSAKIATDAVGTSEIAADAVTSSEIATDAVGTAEIAADAVTSSEIAADAVGTAEIANDAVTAAKIAADAVGTSEIAADAVTSSEIAADAVGDSELDLANLAMNQAWTTYTPGVNVWTKGNGTTSGAYLQVGKTVHFWAKFVLGSTSVLNAAGGIDLPVAPANALVGGAAHYLDSPTTHYTGVWYAGTAGTGAVVCHAFEDGLSKNVGVGNSPFVSAWTTGDSVLIQGTYEVA